jgi:hypothetical protein
LLTYRKTGVIQNAIYNLRLQAKNIYGWGAFSDVLTIAAYGIPADILYVRTVNLGADVIITWQPNNTEPITSFNVKI